MEKGIRNMQSRSDKSILLKTLYQKQKQYAEGSFEWADLQAEIDRIVAQNYLEYLNR